MLPENVKELLKVERLRAFQEEALEKGVLEKNLVVSAPTASGKTLIAEISLLHSILNQGGKVLYVVPLRSLAREKYFDFKRKYSNIRVGISVGNLDESDEKLSDKDLIIITSEKLDSLLRHGAHWLWRVNNVIVDEAHLISDASRGATLEVVLTVLKKSLKARFLLLSATISNAGELAEWLNSELVKTDYRPVRLRHGVLVDDRIVFEGGEEVSVNRFFNEPSYDLTRDDQCLVFVNSRRRAQKLALEHPGFSDSGLGKRVLTVLETPTEQCKELSACLSKGVAFHHAGLVEKQQRIVEEGFKKGVVRVLYATPTLAMGVNVPARRVVIRDLKRYYHRLGYSDYISVGEYHQFSGRAGRPQYHEEGEAVSVASHEDEANFIFDHFVKGEPEEVVSKLGNEVNLRIHLLGLISQRIIRDEQGVMSFLKHTFYYHQFKDLSDLQSIIRRVLDELEEWGFIELSGGVVKPTRLGSRVAQLYLDPLSAKILVEGIKNCEDGFFNEVTLIHLCLLTTECSPLLSLSEKDYPELLEEFEEVSPFLLLKTPNPFSYEYERFLQAYKTLKPLIAWIEEEKLDNIMRSFGVAPGDLRRRVHNLDWVLYSLKELALLLGNKRLINPVNRLRVRLKHGVKEELLKLVKYKGVGRVRARKLYDKGFVNKKLLREASLSELSAILGLKLAENLKKEVEK